MISTLTALGSPDVVATALLLFAAWLWAAGLARTLLGLIAGIAVVCAATLALKWAVYTPGSTLWPDGALISQYFPSGHAALAAAVYGSLAVILAAAGGGAWRYTPFAALSLSIAVAASRVVTGLHPIGDAFFGVVIGLFSPAATYVGVLRERHPYPNAYLVLAVFVVAFGAAWLLPAPISRYVQW